MLVCPAGKKLVEDHMWQINHYNIGEEATSTDADENGCLFDRNRSDWAPWGYFQYCREVSTIADSTRLELMEKDLNRKHRL